uniref:BHLH domain-containing protein n=1 Tax=Steinernema glaseri TaxID=37863 RepID=A0A1I8A3A6_9BILA
MDIGDAAVPSTSKGRSTKRRLRNECEKRRRDSFNRFINELTDIVADGDRKIDKSNVLLKAIEFLKDRQAKMEAQNSIASAKLRSGSVEETQLCRALNCLPHDLVRAEMEIFGAGMFCLGSNGDILHASPSFASQLGSTCSELHLKSMFSLLPPDATEGLREFLAKQDEKDRIAQIVVGSMELTGKWARVAFSRGKPEASDLIEISAVERDVFVGIARPAGSLPAREFSLDNISSAHLPSGLAFSFVYNGEFTCVAADESGIRLLGYGIFDVVGSSGYAMIHEDDLDSVIESHKQLITAKSMDITPHRLRMESDGYIWVKCFASIQEDCGDTKRIRCVYTPTNAQEKKPKGVPLPHSLSMEDSLSPPKTVVPVSPMVRPPSALVTPLPIFGTPSTPGTSSSTTLPSIHRHQGFPMSPALTEEGAPQTQRSRSQSVGDRKRQLSESVTSPSDALSPRSSRAPAVPEMPAESHFENVLEFFLQKSRELQEQVKRKRIELFKLSQQNGSTAPLFRNGA